MSYASVLHTFGESAKWFRRSVAMRARGARSWAESPDFSRAGLSIGRNESLFVRLFHRESSLQLIEALCVCDFRVEAGQADSERLKRRQRVAKVHREAVLGNPTELEDGLRPCECVRL